MTNSPDAGRPHSTPEGWESVWLCVLTAAPDRVAEADHERARIERIGNDVARTTIAAELADDPGVQELLMQMSLVIPYIPFDRTGFVLAAAAAIGRRRDAPDLTGEALERLHGELVRMNLETVESSFIATRKEEERQAAARAQADEVKFAQRYRELSTVLADLSRNDGQHGPGPLVGEDRMFFKNIAARLRRPSQLAEELEKAQQKLKEVETTELMLKLKKVEREKRQLAAQLKRAKSQPVPRLRPRPKAVLLTSWQDAERHAARWMTYLGYTDAAVTPTGPDGGIDVVAGKAIAQVKAEGYQTGSAVIRQLAGLTVAGPHRRKDMLFFSTFGYSRDALSTAEELGMALFRFADGGEAVAESSTAKKLLKAAAGPVTTKR